jgi:hypothetical protein
LGEVFVRNVGARWRTEEDTPMKGQGGFYLILEVSSNSYCNPIGRVFNRLERGEEASLPYFYSVFADRHGSSPAQESQRSEISKPSLLGRLFRRSK